MLPLLAGGLLFGGCFEEEEEDDYTPEICNNFDAELNSFLAKSNAFNANPSSSSCKSLKSSAISLMNKVKNCPGGQGALSVIEAWQTIDCSDF